MSASSSSRPRRALLLGGASTALGAATVALGQNRAEAAGPAPMLVGRGNNAGARSTGLTATAARTAWVLVQRGAGLGMSVTSAATAVLGAAGLGSAWGVWGRNTATRTSTGGAVRAEGRKNAGLLADTTVQDVPAVVAIGGDGTGVAQVATGQSYLDGDALALRAWTGVLGADGAQVAYAPLVSAESAGHVATGTATLDASGSLQVALPATFTAACDTSALAVTLTPVGAAMPALFVSYRAAAGGLGGYDGFTVSGGSGGGTVAWTAWATRRAVDLRRTGAATLGESAAGGGNGIGPPAPLGEPGPQPEATRLSRPSLRLPAH
jgi:hypothetical protein